MEAVLEITLVAILVVVLGFSHITSAVQKWRSYFRSFTSHVGTRFIWRKKYPSYGDMHAAFDRGDALMAAVFVATSLQLAHEEVAKTLISHSTYKTDPMRRLMRTLTFIRISVRANSAERSQVVSWLHKIHGNIKLFQLETNMFILSTVAYGLGRAHQVLGSATETEVDAMVTVIMNMGKQLSPGDRDPEIVIPNSLSAVTDLLSKKVKVSVSDLETELSHALHGFGGFRSKRGRRPAKTLSLKSLISFRPLLWMKFFIFMRLTKDLSSRILEPESSNPRPGLVLSILLKLQPLYYHFHYTLCPRFLTFDGLFELLHYNDPSLKFVMDEVYVEIFGENAPATKWRQGVERSSGAHLPQLKTSTSIENSVSNAAPVAPHPAYPVSLPLPSLYSAVVEHLKCSYLRGELVGRTVPYHLGVIMDGNRRFAKQNALADTMEGHRMGAQKLLEVMSWCVSYGIHNVTVWALSDDNKKRGKELDPLFTMMSEYIRETLMGDMPIEVWDLRIRVMGDRSLLPQKLNLAIDEAEKATKKNSKFNLQLALGYGGRAEATRAMKRAAECKSREMSVSIEEALSSLTPSDVSKHTYSAELGLPEMDAILRTSGENRLSGFGLWDTHGAELSFVDSHWPALTQSDFLESIVDLSGRQRRFGA